MTSSSQETISLYKGNSIFRNQPPFTHFNKSFEDETDALFLGLNEINPLFLNPENQQHDAKLFDAQLVVDPRNKQHVTEFLIDHTKPRYPQIFRSPQQSKLTKGQHVIGVRLLLAWQNRDEVNDYDLLVFRRVSRKREQEKIEFLKYVNEYCQAKREKIYAPTKQLVELYTKWYRCRTQLLMTQVENISYNTQSGLPHLKACANNEQIVELVDVEILKRFGHIPVWQSSAEAIDCTLLKSKLQIYATMYVESLEDYEKFTNENYANVVNELREKVDNGIPTLFLPLESLLFLLTVGEYPDLPTEMLLDIEDGQIRFHAPLPSRNCGWHTHKKVVIQSFQAYQSVSTSRQWLKLTDEEVALLPTHESTEVESASKETSAEFKPQLFEDYLKNVPKSLKKASSRLKFGEALVKWQLSDKSNSEKLKILTTLPQPPAIDVEASDYHGGVSIKLEYKPEFGCEVMTKYELLEEWLTMRLLTTHNDQFLHRLRLSASTFETLLTEQLVAPQIEQQLLEIYSVRLPGLLNGLFGFLKLLQNMPNGQYMLRYNPKFRDKLMLCAPSQEITQRTVFLHPLLQAKPSDLDFMTQQHVLPIADNVCSIVHSFHRVLPCTFKPNLKEPQNQRFAENPKKAWLAKSMRAKAAPKSINDRDFILSKIQKKTEASITKEKRFPKRNKGPQKARRRARLRAEKAVLLEQQAEEEELQREIELDKKLFGFN